MDTVLWQFLKSRDFIDESFLMFYFLLYVNRQNCSCLLYDVVWVWWRYRGCFLEWGFLLVRTVQKKRSTISKRSITETHLRLHWNWGKFIIALDLRAHLIDLTWSKHLIRNKIHSKFSVQIVVLTFLKHLSVGRPAVCSRGVVRWSENCRK